MQKRDLWIFRIVTGLFSVMMVGGATMYFVQNDQVREAFTNLGYPTYLIYPLAIAKLLGLVAIWTNKSKMLKEWAYAGFIFDFLLAISSHLNVNDGEHWGATMALVLVSVSYFYNRKLYPTYVD
ncbi:MAG: DoxX family protein [Saprospiraceae bacterium]|nr:DoxX family protein [Saprospiraceae bacterium]